MKDRHHHHHHRHLNITILLTIVTIIITNIIITITSPTSSSPSSSSSQSSTSIITIIITSPLETSLTEKKKRIKNQRKTKNLLLKNSQRTYSNIMFLIHVISTKILPSTRHTMMQQQFSEEGWCFFSSNGLKRLGQFFTAAGHELRPGEQEVHQEVRHRISIFVPCSRAASRFCFYPYTCRTTLPKSGVLHVLLKDLNC